MGLSIQMIRLSGAVSMILIGFLAKYDDFAVVRLEAVQLVGTPMMT